MQGILVLLVLVVLAALAVMAMYNALVAKRNLVKNAWSDVDVQLKRRHDLIPNLVETAKGYMAHESGTLTAVIQARQAAVNAQGVAATAEAENALTQTLRSLFAVAEAYPDLKANQNMLQLQNELAATENRIAQARQYYNQAAMQLNVAVEQFPSGVVARTFGFEPAEMFEVADVAERDAPQVKF